MPSPLRAIAALGFDRVRSTGGPILRCVSDTPSELLRLASADNFRDVAGVGAGYPTTDGGRVRRGVCYRSNELQLHEADVAAIADLGIQVIHDLRSTLEIEAHPDVPVPGARWQQLDVSGIPTEMIEILPDTAAAERVMLDVYESFVRSEQARTSYAALLTCLATDDLPQLFHCTAGKDRTGWAAALLLEVAGVDRATILEDYLLTNEVSSITRTKYLALIEEHLGAEKMAVYEPTLVVKEAYLQMAYDAVAADHGSVAGYLRDGLGLSDDVLGRLRERLRG